MSIRQLQVANDNVQDRLLLRIATEKNEEIRIFVTRRFLREIWPHLRRVLAGYLATLPETSGEASGPREPPSFEQAFKEDNPNFPLGSTPLLASEATLEGSGEGITRLTMREGRERSFRLELGGELLQALCSMLRAASDKAKWDLDLSYEPTAAIVSPPGKSLLH